MDDREKYDLLHGGSFADRNPFLAVLIIVFYVAIAGFPAIAMLSSTVACKIGATDPFCPTTPTPREE